MDNCSILYITSCVLWQYFVQSLSFFFIIKGLLPFHHNKVQNFQLSECTSIITSVTFLISCNILVFSSWENYTGECTGKSITICTLSFYSSLLIISLSRSLYAFILYLIFSTILTWKSLADCDTRPGKTFDISWFGSQVTYLHFPTQICLQIRLCFLFLSKCTV